MSERLWTGSDGKYQVLASYVCLFQDKKVKLKKPNGALVAVPLTFLCPEDIAFISTQAKLIKQDSSTTIDTIAQSSTSSLSTSPTFLTADKPSSVSSCKATPAASPQNARQISQDESIDMIPKRSLSSLTDQFKRQTYCAPEDAASADSKNLTHLPTKVVIKIAQFLDVRSRLQFSAVSKRCHQLTYRPDVWKSVTFRATDQYMVNDQLVYQIIVFLQLRGALHSAIQHVNLDSTMITANTVLMLIKYLENLETLSVQSCWQLYTLDLATQLSQLAKTAPNQYPSKMARVTLGKVLHRGPATTTTTDNNNNHNHPSGHDRQLESKSFGQDAWFINAALNKLAKRNVAFDVTLCSTCHIGAAAQELNCASCGILPLVKCVTCAPRCDRCGNRSCGLSSCSDPRFKVQAARCGRCESTLTLCNNEKSKACQQGRQPCESCHRLYHTRCRASDGTYVSNQCTLCGITACPHCELTSCSGGCRGQWCKRCLPNASMGRCKCIVIEGKAETSTNKSMSKRSVCGKCRKSCKRCGFDHFCHRCLKLHSNKCNI